MCLTKWVDVKNQRNLIRRTSSNLKKNPSSVETLAQPVAAAGVHQYTMQAANRGRSHDSPHSSQSAADLNVNPSESMTGGIGRSLHASHETLVTEEMHFSMAAQLRKEMNLRVTALANSLVSTLEERLSVATRHMEDQLASLRSEISPLLRVETRGIRFDEEVEAVLQMDLRLEDLRKEVCEIRELMESRQAFSSSSWAVDTATSPRGTSNESVPVPPEGIPRVMFESETLPSVSRDGESMFMPRDREMSHDSCRDGTVDGEHSDRQAGMSVGSRSEVVSLSRCRRGDDLDQNSYDMSSKVSVSKVEHQTSEDRCPSSRVGSFDPESQECTLVQLARQLRVNADRIDVLQHDYQTA